MKSALLTIILVISIGFTIKGQNVRLGKVIVSPRIYANYHFIGSRLVHKTRYSNTEKVLNFYRPTIGVLLRRPGRRRAIEIEATAWIRREDYRVKFFKEQFLALRFEYGNYRKFYILKKKFNYRFNISVQAFKSYDRIQFNSSRPPSRNDRTGAIFSIIPHLEIPLGERVFIDINIPMINAGIFNWKNEYDSRGWVTNTMSTEDLIRFGFGVKL